MARSILIPCGRCAHENLPQNRFCGMCGFPLPSSPLAETPAQEPQNSAAPKGIDDFLSPVSATETGYNRQARSVGESPRREAPSTPRFTSRPSLLNLDEPKPAVEPANTVSGPSFLGLASESDRDRVSYLLEDDQSTSHYGRFVGLILILLIIALGAAAWHWREQMGPLAARLSKRGMQASTQPTDNSGSPISTSPSEVSPTAPNGDSAEKPKTGVGDMPTNPPQNQNQAAANNPAAGNNAPATNAENPQQQPAAAAQDNQAALGNSATPTPESKDSGSAANPADKQDSQGADAEQAMQQQTAKNVVPKRPSKSSSSDSTGTSLEADGEKYLYGNGVAQDCNRARKSLLSASGQGDAKAQSVLGTMYATGHCAPRDLPLAYKWFAKALHAEPANDRLSQDLKVLWNQMTPDERNLALKNQ